jgi:hypothetical protein
VAQLCYRIEPKQKNPRTVTATTTATAVAPLNILLEGGADPLLASAKNGRQSAISPTIASGQEKQVDSMMYARS